MPAFAIVWGWVLSLPPLETQDYRQKLEVSLPETGLILQLT